MVAPLRGTKTFREAQGGKDEVGEGKGGKRGIKVGEREEMVKKKERKEQ